ncbi:DNA-binding protein [Methylomonas sp. AM2-LC]|uniref:DNA-binding protein n=1 Tax=Methylomonas sp. AM2-LC TaxID=3153301 RepID=UPI003263D7C5
MALRTDTFERAMKACDTILYEENEFPNMDAVRRIIGVNNPATIRSAISVWKEHLAEKLFEKNKQLDIPLVLLDSVNHVWKQAVSEAEKNYVAQEKTLTDQISILNTAVLELQTELTNTQEALKKSLEELTQACIYAEKMQSTIDTLQIQFDEKAREVDELQNKLNEITTLHTENELSWQKSRDKDNEWFARRLDEEKRYTEERWKEKNTQNIQTIQSLKETEAMLRQSGYTLKTENIRLSKLVSELEAAENNRKKMLGVPFKTRIKRSSKMVSD